MLRKFLLVRYSNDINELKNKNFYFLTLVLLSTPNKSHHASDTECLQNLKTVEYRK